MISCSNRFVVTNVIAFFIPGLPLVRLLTLSALAWVLCASHICTCSLMPAPCWHCSL